MVSKNRVRIYAHEREESNDPVKRRAQLIGHLTAAIDR